MSTSQNVSDARTKRALPIAVIAAGALTAATLAACGGSTGSNAAPGGGIVAATAFPATAFGFASLDTDPADGEKGQLVGTLLKFPAFARNVKIGPGDDVRKSLITEAIKHGANKCNLSWENDFKPWLGDVIGVAGVVENGSPQPVGAIQVTDSAKAQAEYAKLVACKGDPHVGVEVTDKWVYVAKTKAIVSDVVNQTKAGTLADNADFKTWTAKAGGGGFATAYAAPSVAGVLTKAFDSLKSSGGPFAQGFTQGLSAAESNNPFASICPNAADPSKMLGEVKTMLSGFKGAAVNLRARNGGVEVEGVMDASWGVNPLADAKANSDIANLPATTAAAISLGLPNNAWDRFMDGFGKVCGPGFDRSKIESKIAQATGLSAPGDLNALLGKGLTLALGGGVDVTQIHKPADAPVALLLNGDPSSVQGIVTKLLAKLPPSFGITASTKGNDVVVTADGTYASSLGSGGLGNDATFKDVVPDAGNSLATIFVNFDQLEASFAKLPSKISENLKPLKALGLSEQVNGDEAHFFFRISTN